MLFNLIIKHGHVPVDFKLGGIAPVIKVKRKDNEDVNNYRPVILISVLAKLFEMFVYKTSWLLWYNRDAVRI